MAIDIGVRGITGLIYRVRHVLCKIDTFDPSKGATFRTWIYAIARHTAYDHIERPSECQVPDEGDAEHWVDKRLQVRASQENTVLVHEALSQLDTTDRELVIC